MFEKLLSKRGLSLDRLRVIAELDEAGSVVEAAGGDLNRQSQYSRQLRQLEDFFELELTRRDGKKLSLTMQASGLRKSHAKVLRASDISNPLFVMRRRP